MNKEVRRFSLRKLSVGLASVLVGISIFGTSQTVKADTVANNQTSSVTNNAQSSDTQENGNAVKSTFLNDNQTGNAKNNMAQTQVEGKKDQKQDSAPKTQEVNDSSDLDAEKDIVRTSSLQESDNQSNNHAEDNSQTQTSQKLDLTKNSKKFAKKVLATNLIATPPVTNGGFDEATWGKLNVNDWKGNVQGDYYQLTDYTGDANHVIVPNEADFEKAGISTSGKQVGVTSSLMHVIFKHSSANIHVTVAFSKTDNKMVKAIDSNWSNTWNPYENFLMSARLSKFDGTSLDVSNVTNMSSMFYGNYISDISTLANWNTDNVKNMSQMFFNNQISDLSPWTSWKVDNVTDMSEMFEHNHIKDLSPLASWHTDNVKDMSNIFQNNQIKDLSPLASWKVDNVKNMSGMFEQNHIKDLSPLASWHTDNVGSMMDMFEQNQISDLSPLANWKVDNVQTMGTMFTNNQISDLSPLVNWKVNNVGEMFGMFGNNQISNLSPLANWKVDNVQTMGSMFYDNQISDLSPLAGWNTNNVSDMSQMFYGNHISDINPLANWNVNSVDYRYSMFDNNSLIITQAKRVINFIYPAGYTGKKQGSVTQTVDLPQKVKIELTTNDSTRSNNILDWVNKTETPEAPDPVYFQDYTVPEIKGLLEPDQTVISKQQADLTKPINVTVTYKLVDSNTNDAFALDSKNGLHEHANVNDNGGYDADFWGKINVDDWNYTVNGDTIEINGLKDGVSTGANDAVIVPNLDDFKLVGKDGGAKAVYISSSALGETAKHKYYGLSKTNGNKFATDSDLHNAFVYSSNLTYADLNSLNTGNVTNMASMFHGTSIKSLDVSNWDTSKVTNMSMMFGGARSLTSLDVSKWDTGKVTDMGYMFKGANSLTNLGVSNWDTGKATNMSGMFNGASRLTSLDVSKWNTGNVTDMGSMFNNASSLTSLDVSKWDTGKVTDMSYMFNAASSLTNLDVSKWDTSKVTDMGGMFKNTSSLTNLDVSNWNTSKVTNMSSMFDDASSLTSLDVSNWDTGNVTDMSLMFYYASGLKSLDVSKWDTSNVTDIYWMFDGASSLMSLDVSNWDTSKVTDMNCMFQNASILTSLDVSNWDTGKVTDMSSMFYYASGLKSLDVSNWDTSKVTDMSNMFDGASSLNNLDVSNWDTSKVTDMSHMFYEASSLALIANSGKFADYLVNHDSFAKSNVNSGVKSVTTDNTKLLQLLTNDSQHDSATRTIVFTFPANYSPDLAKYHLTKNGNTYQIKQSADYAKSYLQGTVLINATGDITKHHIDTTEQYKLSDTWKPNYDKLVLAHKNGDGSVSFDAIQLPKVPGYKAYLVRNKLNFALFTVSFIAVPTENKPSTPVEATPSKPSAPADNPNKPADNLKDLKQRVVTELNSNDSGWTMPTTADTHVIEVPTDSVSIDLSNLVIAEPVHAQTRVKLTVPKRFKLRKHGKKHVIKHLKHRKKAVRTFKKYRL